MTQMCKSCRIQSEFVLVNGGLSHFLIQTIIRKRFWSQRVYTDRPSEPACVTHWQQGKAVVITLLTTQVTEHQRDFQS